MQLNASSEPASAQTILLVILSGGLWCVIMGWMGIRAWRSAERMETDLRHRRRFFIVIGSVYLIGAMSIIFDVFKGTESPWMLAGLPVGIGFIWLYFRTATKIKVPK